MDKKEQFYKDRYLETMGKKAQYCRSGQDWVWFVPKKKRTKKELKPKKEMVIPKLEVGWGKYSNMTPEEKEEYALRPKGKWGQKKEVEVEIESDSESDSDSDSEDEEEYKPEPITIDSIKTTISKFYDTINEFETDYEWEQYKMEIEEMLYYCREKCEKKYDMKWYKLQEEIEQLIRAGEEAFPGEEDEEEE
jgi:hypothetical protein